MGVLACDRRGCERILCDHYSTTYGYLCYSCLDELKTLKGGGGQMSIAEFMHTATCTYSYDSVAEVEEEFKYQE